MENFNSFEEEHGTVEIPVSDRSVVSELSTDFSLPDYQPEIKRLLRVTASMLPPSKYFGAGEAELAGNIDYYVLYMGSDNEIYCVPLTGDYSVNMPIDTKDGATIGEELLAEISMSVESVGGRVTSPRHVTVKCRLRTRARVYGEMPMLSSIRKCDGSIEKLKGEASFCRVSFGVGQTETLTDEIIPDVREGEFRIICADGKPLISEVSAGAGEVICRGDLHLKLLLSREDGGIPVTLVRRIPFSGIVRCDGVTPDCAARARGTMSELTLTVDEGRIGVEACVLLETLAQRNTAVEYVSDIYSTTHESRCEYKTTVLPRAVCAFNKNFTFSESMPISQLGIGEGVQIVDCTGTAVYDGLALENGKRRITGRCRFALQLFDGNDYSGAEAEMPFKYEYDIPEAGKEADLECECEASAVMCRARIDSEKVSFDAEIGLLGRVWENISVTALDKYSLGEELHTECGGVTVCYPSESDTLWSIGKKYNAPTEALIKANKLSQSRADPMKPLNDCKYIIV